jgi:Flp pilus assembly protein TadG
MNLILPAEAKRIRDHRRGESGQVLALTALFMIVLLGFAALAIDVSRAYSDLRFYRAAADASALAGAQDLQVPNSRNVNAAEQTNARQHALESLEQRLNGNATGCGAPSANIVDCALAGTPFVVSIKTPSPSCSSCDPDRSVQVNVTHRDYGLTFARILGSNEWDIGTTSVAGLTFGSQYAVITLRPPKRLGSTFDVKDITVTGGSVVTIQNGDIGSNSNMEISGTGSAVNLDPGFKVFHYSDPQLWVGAPDGKKINNLIPDPNYRYPLMTGARGTATTWDDARTSIAGPTAAVQQASVDAGCAAEAAKLDVTKYTFMAGRALSTVWCYNEGIYLSGSGARDAKIQVGSGDVAILKPGVYYLKSGLNMGSNSHLVGGYEPNLPGVALMFDECNNQCVFNGSSALTIALNAGAKFPASATTGATATAAIDFDNQLVETSGPSSPTPPLLISMLVRKDPACFVPTSPPFQEPTGCDASDNRTVNIAGNGNLVLEGVQYAPTDNIEIHGNSAAAGRVGQLISWTLNYTGGTHINQHYPGNTGNGVLRIDAACSAPAEPCSP